MFTIPADRLPSGFAERIGEVPEEPAPARPASTAVLLRDAAGAAEPELLLLRRHRSSGFVPGAYVFPGGRVDEADSDPRLLDRTDGLDLERMPDPAYWMAAVREIFEETGVLLAHDREGADAPGPAEAPKLAEWRESLLEDEAVLLDLLEEFDLRLSGEDVVYAARWITPVVEPRRYDTHFFLALLPEGREARIDAREMTDAVWATPSDALERFRAGELPMVFPTVKTIESLAGFASARDALDAFRHRPVEPILPRLVRTEGGVGIVVDE